MKLVTVPEMLDVEKEADASGLTYTKMMENAGANLAKEILNLPYAQVDEPEILALVGPGNNGGDALVALAHLAAQGWATCAYLIKRADKDDELIERVISAGGQIVWADSDSDFAQLSVLIESADIFLDGVLGTGIKLPVKEAVAKVLFAAKDILMSLDWPPHVVAVRHGMRTNRP